MWHSIAPSSRKAYQVGFNSFTKFCGQYGITCIPASSETIRFFCAELAEKVKFTTLKTYLAGIRFFHVQAGYHDPTDSPLVHYFCRAIKRLHGNKARTRLPVTIDVLRTLKHQLHIDVSTPVWDKRMLWSAFTIAFYGFLRSSEFVCSKSKPDVTTEATLLISDVSVSHDSLEIHISESKTDPFRKGHTLTLTATHTSTCPVAAFKKYITLRTNAPRDTPVFVFQSGTYLTRFNLTAVLRRLLANAGHDPTVYSSHSFRIGAATTAATVGTLAWLIQTLGRWSSDCYKVYIQCPKNTIFDALRSMANSEPTHNTSVWDPDLHH